MGDPGIPSLNGIPGIPGENTRPAFDSRKSTTRDFWISSLLLMSNVNTILKVHVNKNV